MRKLIVLPGYSKSNLTWAEKMKKDLDQEYETYIVHWKHWEDEKAEHLEEEPGKLKEMIGDEKVLVLAKSIGTWIAVKTLAKVNDKIAALVMCGIPFADIPDKEKSDYQVLANFSADKVICIQNMDDPHGTFIQARGFLRGINPQIKVLEKLATTHDYFYAADFLDFFRSCK